MGIVDLLPFDARGVTTIPDDASGNYSLPSGYLAVTGQVVQPSNHNPPLEDIAAAMTARLPRSGVAPMTGPLKTVTGSASAPAISPNNNPAIGLYWTATGIAFAGSVGGVRFIGELIPYTLLTAPALTVFPYGQTLLRASYPDLWALAQTDIAAGNTFYNNGNGSTTFGIGDLRGRVVAGKDNMGGTAASRLTTAITGSTLGAVGGEQSHTTTSAEMPAHYHTGTTGSESAIHTHALPTIGYRLFTAGSGGVPGAVPPGYSADAQISLGNTGIESANHAHSFTTNNTGGGGAHNNVQPTLVCNYLLYAGA